MRDISWKESGGFLNPNRAGYRLVQGQQIFSLGIACSPNADAAAILFISVLRLLFFVQSPSLYLDRLF
jgi:hypothetical protein